MAAYIHKQDLLLNTWSTMGSREYFPRPETRTTINYSVSTKFISMYRKSQKQLLFNTLLIPKKRRVVAFCFNWSTLSAMGSITVTRGSGLQINRSPYLPPSPEQQTQSSKRTTGQDATQLRTTSRNTTMPDLISRGIRLRLRLRQLPLPHFRAAQ